ncbi:hypothetical protein ACF059_05015 [Streptomyces sp. NPDC016562]|uniref:hypothetical protein n=1 Tax=Streptomyces sp. NPDC016562 TaxID=3364966 RepID=UPI003702C505
MPVTATATATATATDLPPRPVTPPAPGAAPAGEPWHRRARVPLIATTCALPLYVLWARVLATGGGDLAAQEAWAGFVARHPGSAYNLSWYGGLHTGGYSLISPYLMAAFGVVPVTAASGLASTWLTGRLWAGSGVRRAQWPALTAALMLWCQVASGRTTFVLGVTFGLAAVLAGTGGRGGRRTVLTAVCAALTAMASPVAALFLVVVGVSCAARAPERRWAAAAAMVLPPAAVLGLSTWLFPVRGEQPMPYERLWPPLLMGVVVALVVPRSWRVLRSAAVVYAVGVVLACLIPSPVGTNAERLANLVAPPVLLAAAMTASVRIRTAGAGPSRSVDTLGTCRRACAGIALVLALAWVGGNTAAHVADTREVPRWAAKSGGVVRALERLGADRARVEVVMARSHREAAVLAPYVNLARGWNRQADVERGRLFYDGYGGAGVPAGTFSAAAYRAWLNHWAVGFVVLHDGPLDAASEREYALVTSGPAYLEAVWRDDNWRVYRVRDAVPLVDPPGSVVSSDSAALVVRMPRPGTVTLRIAHSRWLRAEGGCLAPADDGSGLTRLSVSRPGDVTVGSAYGIGGRPCAR